MRILKYNLDELTFSYNNIVQNEKFLELLENDYIPCRRHNSHLLFYKRKHVGNILKKAGLNSCNGIYYEILKEHNSKSGKLIFIFTSVPPVEDISKHSLVKRSIVSNYKSLPLNVGDDVTIIRICDVNTLMGSFFLNTKNNKDYETKIKEALLILMDKYNSSSKKTIFMGTSKGGTGALYYGSMFGGHIIVNDPIIDIGEYISKRRNLVYFNDEIELNLTKRINDQISETNPNVFVYCTPRCEWTYKNIINLKNVKLYELDNVDVSEHAQIAAYTTRKIYGLTNYLLLRN